MRFLKMRSLVALATLLVAIAGGRLVLQAQAQAGKLVIHITSNAIGFGSVPVGVLAPPQTITLQNVGGASLQVLNTTRLSGLHVADFTLTNNCGALAPGAMCTMTFTFTPSAQGNREAWLLLYTDAHAYPVGTPIEQPVPVVGFGLDPNVPQPEVGPLDPRTGYPVYYSDGINILELCLDTTPPNDAAGNPLPQQIDPLTGLWTPTMCLAAAPAVDRTQPPSMTFSPATTNWPGEGFWWTAEAEATPAGWKRALLVMAQEAANEASLPGQQWAFGRLRFRADDVPAGTYRLTHPFGADIVTVAVGDDRIFETSDIGCFSTPCDFTLALNTRISRFLQCSNAPSW
jgi:hypothetical protein